MTAEKRTIEKDDVVVKASDIIVDIEGTTSSISFVKETLFPYVREHLEEYVKTNWTNEEFQGDFLALKGQAKVDEADGVEGLVSIPDGDDDEVRKALIKNILWQMDNDRKTKALKQLQGHIWRNGYSNGKLVGHIYDDVQENLKSWTTDGKKVYVYSSGSVEAQKLLFGHTKHGDLLPLFSGHFDTEVGAKTEKASYEKILNKIGKTGEESKNVIFLTDIPKEATAAVEAGLQAVLVSREGNASIPDDVKANFNIINTFSELTFEGNFKRRKVSESETNSIKEKQENSVLDNDVEMKEVEEESNTVPVDKKESLAPEISDLNKTDKEHPKVDKTETEKHINGDASSDGANNIITEETPSKDENNKADEEGKQKSKIADKVEEQVVPNSGISDITGVDKSSAGKPNEEKQSKENELEIQVVSSTEGVKTVDLPEKKTAEAQASSERIEEPAAESKGSSEKAVKKPEAESKIEENLDNKKTDKNEDSKTDNGKVESHICMETDKEKEVGVKVTEDNQQKDKIVNSEKVKEKEEIIAVGKSNVEKEEDKIENNKASETQNGNSNMVEKSKILEEAKDTALSTEVCENKKENLINEVKIDGKQKMDDGKSLIETKTDETVVKDDVVETEKQNGVNKTVPVTTKTNGTETEKNAVVVEEKMDEESVTPVETKLDHGKSKPEDEKMEEDVTEAETKVEAKGESTSNSKVKDELSENKSGSNVPIENKLDSGETGNEKMEEDVTEAEMKVKDSGEIKSNTEANSEVKDKPSEEKSDSKVTMETELVSGECKTGEEKMEEDVMEAETKVDAEGDRPSNNVVNDELSEKISDSKVTIETKLDSEESKTDEEKMEEDVTEAETNVQANGKSPSKVKDESSEKISDSKVTIETKLDSVESKTREEKMEDVTEAETKVEANGVSPSNREVKEESSEKNIGPKVTDESKTSKNYETEKDNTENGATKSESKEEVVSTENKETNGSAPLNNSESDKTGKENNSEETNETGSKTDEIKTNGTCMNGKRETANKEDTLTRIEEKKVEISKGEKLTDPVAEV